MATITVYCRTVLGTFEGSVGIVRTIAARVLPSLYIYAPQKLKITLRTIKGC